MKNNNFYIIDGNAYFYRSFYAIPHLNNSQGLPTNAILGFLNIILKIINDKMTSSDFLCVCFDAGSTTFRNDMYDAYKANRDKMRDSKVSLYYLPEDHYIGISNCIYKRMAVHRSRFDRHTEDVEIVATFDTRAEALHYEKLLHSIGYNGSNW